MKQIILTILCLWGIAYGQTTGYFRYDTIRMQKGGGNSELYIENATRGVTNGVLTNVGNGRTAFITPSTGIDSLTVSGDSICYWIGGVSVCEVGPAPGTLQQAITKGNVLTTDNNIDGGGYNLTFSNNSNLILSASNAGITTNVDISGGVSITATGSSRNSELHIDEDSIQIQPGLGNLLIDTLTSAPGVYALRWNPTTGLVSAADTTSAGSAINKADTNLLNLSISSIVKTPIGAGVVNIKNRTGQYYNGGKIVFFGDSYTEGSGATVPAKRWTSLVSSALGAVELNLGVAGTTAEKRTPQDYMAAPNAVDDTVRIPYKTQQFKMLVAAWNLNDMGQTAAAYTTANYITDYSLFIQACINRGWLPSEILIIGSYWIGPAGYATYATITGNAAPTVSRHESFLAAAKTVSQNFSTMFLDVYTDQKHNDTTLIAADHIHPTDSGYAFIAADVLQYLGAEPVSATATTIPYANNIIFQNVTGIVAEGKKWTSPVAGVYGNTGLADTTFTGDRRLIFNGASYGGFYGLNSANAQTGYLGMEAAMLLSGVDLYIVDNGVFSGAPVATVSNTDLISLERSGSAFTVKSSSDGGLTWSAAIYTFGYTSSAVHYIVTDIAGTPTNGHIDNPRIAYLTGSSYVNIATLKTTAVAFALLPAGVTGMIATVNDSNTNTWGATIAGGGANTVLAFYNGSNWTVIGK